MLREHILPVALKLKEQAANMEKEEEEYLMEIRRMQHRKDSGEIESEVQEVCSYKRFHFAMLIAWLCFLCESYAKSTDDAICTSFA